ncbi:thioesterase-like superfamily protein [Nitzschia inconspicua]|uniref:Thioesterase-like superfamily protein n=1 Tax=Nitzschia inconspicua TaxID=303405 RepID=A0A9K3KZV0_9STRA|nr:thioesterase-like superfamily protein [Nitzschia inconspicua]
MEANRDGNHLSAQLPSFTSPPIRVYIEDTDAYGIIYNSNYLRMFDRALFAASIKQEELQTVLGNNSEWSVLAVGHQKFVSSPVLGSEVVIQGQLVQTLSTESNNDQNSCWSVWNMEMRSPDGTRIYNVVTNVIIASRFSVRDVDTVKDILPISAFDDADKQEVNDNLSTLACHETLSIHRDELDAHSTAEEGSQLPLRNILSYFERGRTNLFGGPSNLRRLKEQDGVLAVVTGVHNLSPVWRKQGDLWRPHAVAPGVEIDLTSAVQVKRKGMIIEFYQTISIPIDGHNVVVAQGQVNLMMVDATTMRPTAKLPPWAKDLLQIPN